MKTTITLWECPPLRARLSRTQCERNRARAAAGGAGWRSALSKLDDVPLGPSECLRCPGVDWWAERGRPPREVLPSEILREHRQKEALRCRLAGRPDRPQPTAHRRRRQRAERSAAGPLLAD